MIIRLAAAFCAAILVSACGRVDYGLEGRDHKVIKDMVICRGDKYPTGFHAGHVDRQTLEVLKLKCDAQYGKGKFPIEIVIESDPNIQKFEYRDSYDSDHKPVHNIYGKFCPTKHEYKVKVDGEHVGGNVSQIGECRYENLGTRRISGNGHNGQPVSLF